MRAMILAAGEGKRMRELTQDKPKPLLRVGNFYLIEYAIHQLKRAEIFDVVINVSYHADQIKNTIGDGSHYDMRITYSEEQERLETGGGIVKALPHLGNEPFIVISSDIITDFPLENLPKKFDHLAHLVMVTNPSYHPTGDYHLHEDGKLSLSESTSRLTFASIGVYHPKLFANCRIEHFRLTKLLTPAIQANQITGEHYQGKWHNIGTPEDIKTFDNKAHINHVNKVAVTK